MDINVDRTHTSEGNLIFTITVNEPHHSCFGEIEKKMMNILDVCKERVDRLTPHENKLKDDIVSLIHQIKEKTFMRVLSNLKFAIENEFRPKFQPICQEIYNWINDNQTDVLKKWMSEFDPQRTRYYFDNDPEVKRPVVPQESEYDDDEDDQEDDD